MDKDSVLNRIHEIGVIGIFRVDNPEDCAKAMDALREGGLRALEVTLTTPNAIQVMHEAKKRYGDETILGVGTVLDAKTAEKAIEMGAQIIVSPSTHKEIM